MQYPLSNDEYKTAKELFKKITPYILLSLAEGSYSLAERYDKIMLKIEQEVEYDNTQHKKTSAKTCPRE